MCSPGRADQIRSSNSPDSPVRIITVRLGPHQLAHQAGGQVRGAAPEPGRQSFHADQARLVPVDEDNPTGVGTGQFAHAGGDLVKHGLQVALGVHVGHHVAELAHHPGPLGRMVPGHGVLPGPVAHVHPADHLARAVAQRTGVDAQVQQRAVLARATGHERDLPAGTHPLQRRVVLGLAALRGSAAAPGRAPPPQLQPNMRSAAGFHNSTVRSVLNAMMGSAAHSTTARDVASMRSCPATTASGLTPASSHHAAVLARKTGPGGPMAQVSPER